MWTNWFYPNKESYLLTVLISSMKAHLILIEVTQKIGRTAPLPYVRHMLGVCQMCHTTLIKVQCGLERKIC